MRYPDGGGLSPAARERRKTVRLQAARLFAQDVAPGQVATRLRVSPKSAYQWRRRWRAGGEAALASTGPGGASCRLSDVQLHRLREELERGPAEHGWVDQRWTPGGRQSQECGARPAEMAVSGPGSGPRACSVAHCLQGH